MINFSASSPALAEHVDDGGFLLIRLPMLAQLKSTSFEWGESSDPEALASSALTLATRICLNILLLSNARIDTDKYFFDSDGCTRTCSIISTQYIAGGMSSLSL